MQRAREVLEAGRIRHTQSWRPVVSAVTRTSLRLPWVGVPFLTLGLGATVAVSWFVFGGRTAFLGPERALGESWPMIYSAEALFAAAGTFWFARLAAPLTPRQLVAYVVAAWIGEWLVLLFAGRLFSGELVPEVSWYYWLIGTGGPVQPVAAAVGGLLALRGRDTRAEPT
jgi:hypothetical protein